jgi:hypothetical protein
MIRSRPRAVTALRTAAAAAAATAAATAVLAGCDNVDVALKVGSNGTPPPTPSGMVADGRYFRDAGGTPRFLVGFYDDVTFTGLERVNTEQTSFGRIVDRSIGAINYIHMIVDETTFYSGVLPYRIVGNKLDLDTWDPRYWDAVREDVGRARARQLTVLLSIFDVFAWTYSPWNRKFHARDYYGDLDVNANGTVDEPGDFYRIEDFRNNVGVGRYQRRLIEKTIAEVGWAENVMLGLGVAMDQAPPEWTEVVVAFIKQLRPGPVVLQSNTYPVKIDARRSQCCRTAMQIKDNVPLAVGKGYPVLLDSILASNQAPDAEYNRRAAWYALTTGAAGWGGFQIGAYHPAYAESTRLSLIYSAMLLRFLGVLGGELARMVPDQTLVSNPARTAMLASPGRAYVAYVGGGDEEVTIRLVNTNARFLMRMFDPREGMFSSDQRLVEGAQPIVQRKPLGWDDWVIMLTTTVPFQR